MPLLRAMYLQIYQVLDTIVPQVERVRGCLEVMS